MRLEVAKGFSHQVTDAGFGKTRLRVCCQEPSVFLGFACCRRGAVNSARQILDQTVHPKRSHVSSVKTMALLKWKMQTELAGFEKQEGTR